jgi:predicted ATPase
LLQQPETRLLTLVGPGGIGKTRLALAVARTILDSRFLILDSDDSSTPTTQLRGALRAPKYEDGVFFVSLAPLTSATALAPTISSAIGLQPAGGDPRQELCDALGNKQMLLILDNIEHLLPEAPTTGQEGRGSEAIELVIQLLAWAPAVQLLVTSRQRLKLRGETLYAVPGLPFSPQATLADATTSAALRLFVQSAQRVAPHFALSAENLPALLRICSLVEGMPLGLEMAAAYIDQLQPAEIAQELEKNVDFLTAEWHDAPERQRSMRAVFDWSWRLLNESEQQVLRQLAAFRGGFTRDAAER